MTKVVCDKCGVVLDPGVIGDKVLKKTCYECVIKSTNRSPKGRILKVNQERILGASRQKLEGKPPKPPQLVMNYQWIEESAEHPERELVLMVTLMTYEKKVLFQAGFPRHKLEEFIEDMKEQETEAKLDANL